MDCLSEFWLVPKLRGKAKLLAACERLFINHSFANMQLLYFMPN